jgi:hypothetical protein
MNFWKMVMVIINRNLSSILICILLSFLLTTCKETSTEPLQPKGIISGDVVQETEAQNIIHNGNGVTVALEGTSFVTSPDSNGHWVIKGVPAGTYNVVLSKNGYGTLKCLGYKFKGTGNSDFGLCTLGQIPSFNVSTITASIETQNQDDIVVLSGTLSSMAPYQRTLWVCFGKDSTVSNQNFTAHTSYYFTVLDSSSTFYRWEPVSVIKDCGFTSGDTVYVAAYGAVIGSSIVHLDNSQDDTPTSVSSVVTRTSFIMP